MGQPHAETCFGKEATAGSRKPSFYADQSLGHLQSLEQALNTKPLGPLVDMDEPVSVLDLGLWGWIRGKRGEHRSGSWSSPRLVDLGFFGFSGLSISPCLRSIFARIFPR